MANKILAVIEQREGQIKRFGFEAASTAVNIAQDLNSKADAVVVGNEIENIKDVTSYGISKLTHLKSADLANYSSSGYAEAIANFAKETGYDTIILANTALGKDLAPRLSVRLDAACVVDCVKISVEGDAMIFTRPAYAGKALIDLKLLAELLSRSLMLLLLRFCMPE